MASLDFENAKEKGIVAPFAVDFMAFDSVNGRDSINFKKTAENLARHQYRLNYRCNTF